MVADGVVNRDVGGNPAKFADERRGFDGEFLQGRVLNVDAVAVDADVVVVGARIVEKPHQPGPRVTKKVADMRIGRDEQASFGNIGLH